MVIAEIIIAAVVALIVLLTVVRSVRIIPQARARNVERFGRYRKTLEPGLNFIVPFVDRVKTSIDLREQVVSFNGQPVITEDNLSVQIDTVLFFQVTDPRAADYEIVNYIQAIEQITATMLRSVIGSMDLEQTLTSRDKINTLLRGVLDDASGQVGHPGDPGGDQGDRPAEVREGRDGEADARRAREARRHPDRRGAAAVADPHRGRRQAEQDPACRGRQAGGDPARRGRGAGDHPGLRVDPPQRPGPEAARLPVPADAAAARQRRGQHVLGDPERGDVGAEGGDVGIHRRERPRRQAAAGPARQGDQPASAVPPAPAAQQVPSPEVQAAIPWQASPQEPGAQLEEQPAPHPELTLDTDPAMGAGVTQVSPPNSTAAAPRQAKIASTTASTQTSTTATIRVRARDPGRATPVGSPKASAPRAQAD